jgi:O-antigen ligase
LFEAPLMLVIAVCISMSGAFRTRIFAVWAAVPWLRNLLIGYFAIETVSLVYSTDVSSSANIFVNQQILGAVALVAATYIFQVPGRAEKFIGLLCLTIGFLFFIGLLERHMSKLPWAGHVPSIFQIDDPNVERFLSGGDRLGVHRVQTIFTTPLALGEYVALVIPFTIYFATNAFPSYVRFIGSCALPAFVVLVFISQSRVGTVGVALTMLLYPTIASFFAWRTSAGIIPATIIYASPLLVGVTAAALFLVDGIRLRVFGSASVASSTESRKIQWEQGLPAFFHRPWGYGIGQGATAVGYSTTGEVTIDTNYLRNLVEFGAVGFVVYMGMLIAAPAYAFRGALLCLPLKDRELNLLLPLTVSFIVFLVTRSSYAAYENSMLIFVFWGLLAALMSRLNDRLTAPATSPAAKLNNLPQK